MHILVPLTQLYNSHMPRFSQDFVGPIHPSYPESDHTFVFNWLNFIRSNREPRCQSDSHLRRGG
ncbi:hypothetical protein F5X99DRAFT_365120 [Biscogniauxia marginata]|nr:hypothetical protein F5X99DRAFT_365120 [Biscogniauxia marginata]